MYTCTYTSYAIYKPVHCGLIEINLKPNERIGSFGFSLEMFGTKLGRISGSIPPCRNQLRQT